MPADGRWDLTRRLKGASENKQRLVIFFLSDAVHKLLYGSESRQLKDSRH